MKIVIIVCARILGVVLLVSITVAVTCCYLRKRKVNKTEAPANTPVYNIPSITDGRESGYYDDLCEGKMDKGETLDTYQEITDLDIDQKQQADDDYLKPIPHPSPPPPIKTPECHEYSDPDYYLKSAETKEIPNYLELKDAQDEMSIPESKQPKYLSIRK